MAQRSFFWNGVTTGDANVWVVPTDDGIGYHMSSLEVVSPWVDIMSRALWNGTGNRGVLLGWLNDLAVTGVATPVSVDTGGAVVYGLVYENDAAVTVAIPTPTNETRSDRIVVRRDWSLQTARITRIAGVEGGGIPALTQSPAPDGTGIYDVPLATAEVTTGGAITLTDDREYCTFSTSPFDGTITTAHLVNEGAGLVARTTRTCRLFVSAMDMETPIPLSGDWQPVYQNKTYVEGVGFAQHPSINPTWDGTLPPGWDGSTATAKMTTLNSAFRVPDNLAGTSMTTYLWWITPIWTALSFYWQSAYQKWRPDGAVAYGEGISSTYISGTYVLDQVYRTELRPVTGLSGDEMVYYWADQRNTAGNDYARTLGFEFVYTGYAP